MLVARARAGDHDAFAVLTARYQDRVYAIARSFVRDSEDALDLAQETFVKAFRGLGGFRGGPGLCTWLCRIAANSSRDWLRKQARRKAVSLDDEEIQGSGFEPPATDALSDPAGVAEREELRAAVRSAVQKLPEELRLAVLLHDIEGLSQRNVAEATGCCLGTAKTRVFRGRARLRRLLGAYVEGRG